MEAIKEHRRAEFGWREETGIERAGDRVRRIIAFRGDQITPLHACELHTTYRTPIYRVYNQSRIHPLSTLCDTGLCYSKYPVIYSQFFLPVYREDDFLPRRKEIGIFQSFRFAQFQMNNKIEIKKIKQRNNVAKQEKFASLTYPHKTHKTHHHSTKISPKALSLSKKK